MSNSSEMPGLEKILRGIVNYEKLMKPAMVGKFKEIGENPHPKALMFSCMDSRILITRLLQAEVGDNFLVRNAGALVPHNSLINPKSMTTEPGALELACIRNNIKQVVVCGHSDCKAMICLFGIKDQLHLSEGTPLELWLKLHGALSVEKYKIFEKQGPSKPLLFQAETKDKLFEAYIDPEDKLKVEDKFSQINTLQQLENIASHPMLTTKLEKGEVRLNALWFDINTADFYMFSKEKKRFIDVSENYDHLIVDGNCELGAGGD